MKQTAAIVLAALFCASLITAFFELPPAVVDLRLPVGAHLSDSGVEHPVTAVLLNFRGYDTLLEIGVLLLALVVVLAVAGREPPPAPARTDPVLQVLARIAAPLMLFAAVWLLWAGAFRPGGAFQAGAVLAAAAVLLHLAGLLPAWGRPGLWLRLGFCAGFLIFLAVGVALLAEGRLLQFPPAWAGALILLIEAGLTFSLGLMLAGLFLFLSHETRRGGPGETRPPRPQAGHPPAPGKDT